MIRPGSNLRFDPFNQEILLRHWEGEYLEPCLRFLVIIAGMIYHEQEASRLTIMKLLGNNKEDLESKEGPHFYGCAADVSIRELIDPRYKDPDLMTRMEFPKARFITNRINELVPFGQGAKHSAIYNVNPGHIHLEVPIGGYKKNSYALSDWMQKGACGLPRPIGRG